MDFLLGRRTAGDADATLLRSVEDASGGRGAGLPPLEVPVEQQRIIDDLSTETDARLEAALLAIATLKSIGNERTALLEQSRTTVGRLTKELSSLTKEVADTRAALERARLTHQAELEELEDKYGDEEERDRYVKDLEKELKQWRKVGSQSQGQQMMMIQPVQSVTLATSPSSYPAAASGAATGDASAETTTGDGLVSSDDHGHIQGSEQATGGNSGLQPRSEGMGEAVAGANELNAAIDKLKASEADLKNRLAQQHEKHNATVAGLREEIKQLKLETESSTKTIRELEMRCRSLDAESDLRDDNLSAMYEECRALREAASNAELIAKAAEERESRERERTIAAEARLSEARADLEAEESKHQQTIRQLLATQKEVHLKADAVKVLKLEMARRVTVQGGSAGRPSTQKTKKKSSPMSDPLADAEEGRTDGEEGKMSADFGDGGDEDTFLNSDLNTAAAEGGRRIRSAGQAFTADGAVIQVDLNALYMKMASADSWRKAWEKLRERQTQVQSLGRTQRMVVAGVILFILWVCYVLMSAIILADGEGDDEVRAMARRLVMCEGLLQSLKNKQEELSTSAAAFSSPLLTQ